MKLLLYYTVSIILTFSCCVAAQVKPPARPEVIGGWQLPLNFWSYPASLHEHTQWISSETLIIGEEIKAVVGVVKRSDAQDPSLAYEDLYYMIDVEKKMQDGNWLVIARLPIHLRTLDKKDLLKKAKDIVSIDKNVVSFKFKETTIKLQLK